MSHTAISTKRRPAVGTAILLVGSGVIGIAAIISLTTNLSSLLPNAFMELSFSLPKFDIESVNEIDGSRGNETYKAYQQMQLVAGGVMAVAMIWAALSRIFESTDLAIVQKGTSNKIISKSVIFVLFIFIFPYLWDLSASIMEDVGLWILNPHYSFDRENPCPANWSDERIVEEYNNSPFKKVLDSDEIQRDGNAYQDFQRGITSEERETTFSESKIDEAEQVCLPSWKVKYVFAQSLGITELNEIRASNYSPDDPFDDLGKKIFSFDYEAAFVGTFLALIKALITLNIIILTFVVGVMMDTFIGLLIAALPLFLFMSLIPKADKIADQFIESLPALMLWPILSAIIMVVGAGFVVGISSDACVDTDGLLVKDLDSTVRCPVNTDAVENLPGSGSQLVYAWLSSLGIIFLTVFLPAALVPMLNLAVSNATRAVTTAVGSSAMVMGTAGAGMTRGLMSANKMSGGLRTAFDRGHIAHTMGMLGKSTGKAMEPSLLHMVSAASGTQAGAIIHAGEKVEHEPYPQINNEKESATLPLQESTGRGPLDYRNSGNIINNDNGPPKEGTLTTEGQPVGKSTEESPNPINASTGQEINKSVEDLKDAVGAVGGLKENMKEIQTEQAYNRSSQMFDRASAGIENEDDIWGRDE